MNDQQKMIKEDINFLEYPNWVINKRSKAQRWTIKKENGTYEVVSVKGLPSHFDKTVLYFLLYKLYRQTELNTFFLTTTRYEIAKNVFSECRTIGKNKYDRIMDSLEKWNQIAINFKGLFYGDDGITKRFFHLVDEVVLRDESGELMVRFNEGYIKQLKETKFYKLIDFEKYKTLKRASSARLYEILAKTFKGRGEWAIDIKKLAEKLTFEKRENAADYYPSDVLRHLKPSIVEINKKTDLEIGFTYNKETDTCIFKKLKKQKNTYIAATKDNGENKKIKQNTQKEIYACMEYFKALEVAEQQRIRNKAIHDPYLVVLKTEEEKIYAHMTSTKQWQPLKN